MPEHQMYRLPPEFIEPLIRCIVGSIKHHFFNFDGDPPIPEEEIRQALINGGGYIRMREDRNRFLVLTHRNGHLYVHEGIMRGEVLAAKTFVDSWDDTYHIDDDRNVHLGIDGLAFLVKKIADGNFDVTVLNLSKIEIQYFIDGLQERQALAPST